VAAGSTGTIPATARLLATITALTHCAVVLSGRDTDMADEAQVQALAAAAVAAYGGLDIVVLAKAPARRAQNSQVLRTLRSMWQKLEARTKHDQ